MIRERFIKTKFDTVHQVQEVVGDLFYTTRKIGFDNLTATRETIVKESNNIEDLFDAVVIINKKRKILSVDENGVVTYDGVGNDDATIYGAVLTKRKNGLAMVASKDGENWRLLDLL